MSKFKQNFWIVAFLAALSSALVLVGGVGIEHMSDRILPIIPLVVALPGLNSLAGDYAAVIAAHTGDPTERTISRKSLVRAIVRVLGINIIGIVVLSLAVGAGRGYVLEPSFIMRFGLFIAVAICVVVAGIYILTQALDRVLLAKRYNPDDLLIPISTAVADVGMMMMVTLAAFLVF